MFKLIIVGTVLSVAALAQQSVRTLKAGSFLLSPDVTPSVLASQQQTFTQQELKKYVE